MFSKDKMKTILWRLAGLSLGVLLVAGGGTLGPGLSLLVQPAGSALAASPAPEDACQSLWDASSKPLTPPYHFHFVHTGPNGTTTTMESIYVEGTAYALVRGKWFRMPYSSDDTKELMKENLKNAKNVSCHVVRAEMVNGEIATVYSVHSETERGIHDSQVWISKSKGAFLREETDAQEPGKSGKSHVSLRLDYNNVQAPKISEPIR